MAIALSNNQKRIDRCCYVRQLASESCLLVLQKTFKTNYIISEVQFRDWWLDELNKSKEIVLGGGWYDPPPYGIGVLFGDEKHFERVSYSTLRPEYYWPKENIFLQKNGLGYIFASPYSLVDGTPIIGDFGFTFYLGKNPKIIDYFKKCSEVLRQLTDLIVLDMSYRELYEKSLAFIKKNNLLNDISSTTDRAGTNIGHCIPFIDRDPTEIEWEILKENDRFKIHKVLSKARRFINKDEDFQIVGNSAFTFEPRFTSAIDNALPMCSFHTIIQFVGGKKVVLTNFNRIFNLLGMNWLKN